MVTGCCGAEVRLSIGTVAACGLDVNACSQYMFC